MERSIKIEGGHEKRLTDVIISMKKRKKIHKNDRDTEKQER